jgi:AraC family transcriptional activator of tynA and feaB
VQTVFSTTDVHPRDQFDDWHDVANGPLVDHESAPECRQSFETELRLAAFAGLGLVMFENANDTAHIAHHAARATGDELFICRQLAGKLLREREGREITLEPGHITLLDLRWPHAGSFFAGSHLLMVR